VFDVVALPFVVVFALVYVKLGVLPTLSILAVLIVLRQLSSANEALHSSNRELLELTVTTLEARDPYTSGHSRRVARYSRMIGQSLNLSQKQLERLSVAALLHDVGKIHEVFAPILSKPGKLTPEERAVMETHPIKGAELVKISSHLRDAVDPIRHHHEAWDGSGYPDGIKGESIPSFSRIIAIADTVDAMASDRPYRRGLGAEKIRDELIRMRGVQFDPAMVDQIIRTGCLDSILRLAVTQVERPSVTPARLSLISSA
jgi:HD-GYP domain-containing protein (c-di-GMP phosphodiesterase class II)